MNSGITLLKILEQIALTMLDDQQTGQVVLHFNQGGLHNRNAPETAKRLVSSLLVPASEARGRQRTDITGCIACNMHEGKLQGMPRFELKEVERPTKYIPQGITGRYISSGI